MKLMKGNAYYAGYENARKGGNAAWYGPASELDEYAEGVRDFHADQRLKDAVLEQDLNECIGQETATQQFESLARDPSDSAAWNVNGVPPVGCECEFKPYDNSEWRIGTVNYLSNHTIVIGLDKTDDEGMAEIVKHPRTLMYRPIRTEAQRKRDEVINALSEHFGHGARLYNISGLYDKIAAGKIPHLKVEA